MKAYWITRCHVHNAEEYDEYIKLAGPAITKFGGSFLVRGGDQIESMEKAEFCYQSDEYQEALMYSKNSSNRHVVLVEGVE